MKTKNDLDEKLRAAVRHYIDALVTEPIDLWPSVKAQLAPDPTRARGRLRIRWIVSIATLALLALLAFFLWPPAKPATAEEVIHWVLTESTRGVGAGEVLYERFLITTPPGALSRASGATAQLWQSDAPHAIRFEVVNQDDKLVMFTLRNADHLWQSLHFRNPIATEVQAILEVPNADPEVAYPRTPLGLPRPVEEASPFRKGILYALPDLDQLILHSSSECAGIACLTQGLEEIDSGIELRLQDSTRQQNYYQVDILDAASGVMLGSMTIDAGNFTLLKFVDQQGVVVRLLERQILDQSMVSADLFSSPPSGVRVLFIPEGWEQAKGQSEDLTDRIWVISTEPEPGLLSTDEVTVTLGYRLVSRPLSSLRVYLQPYFPFCSEHEDGCASGVVAAAEAMVAVGEESIELHMPIDPWDAKGQVVLMAEFTSLGTMKTFEEYLWEFPSNDSR